MPRELREEEDEEEQGDAGGEAFGAGPGAPTPAALADAQHPVCLEALAPRPLPSSRKRATAFPRSFSGDIIP